VQFEKIAEKFLLRQRVSRCQSLETRTTQVDTVAHETQVTRGGKHSAKEQNSLIQRYNCSSHYMHLLQET